MNTARLASLLVLVLLLCACGKTRNMVVLMPDPDGHVGIVDVANKQGTQTLTQAGTATRIPKGAAPTAPELLSDQEREQVFGVALRALPAKPVRFILYFDTDGVKLTQESAALLPKIQQTVKERASKDISVVGHSSKLGDENFNIALSRKRAEFVSTVLIKDGVAKQSVEITSHGSSNPLVISTNANEPKNRRVEVTIR